MSGFTPTLATGASALPPEPEAFVQSLNFDKAGGLLPAVVQHVNTGAVLMLGYMNAEALRLTMDSGLVHFFSRSRQRIWMKGESSGNTLALRTIRADCDQDSLLVQVMPKGPVCHTGQETCWGAAAAGTLQRLEQRLLARTAESDTEKSYTARLVAAGLPRIAQKVGEEGVECALAAVVGTPEALTGEAADLLYHLTLLLLQRGLSLQEVWDVLEQRALKPG
jgi:phosphoribosyl-ATP pyrophosphohydrolase/phosphoribosyl-AMP cyclohydrolase